MINKAIRILIVEPLHSEALRLERVFNALGYYCVQPLISMTEAYSLGHGSTTPFDLVIANRKTLENHSIAEDWLTYNAELLRTRHLHLYQDDEEPRGVLDIHTTSGEAMSVSTKPGYHCIQLLMLKVDCLSRASSDKNTMPRHTTIEWKVEQSHIQ